MLWTKQNGIWRVEHNVGAVGDATPGAAVTTGSTSSTKGTPAELIASTAFDAHWVTIFALGYRATNTQSSGAMDLLIGASTEAVLIANLLHGHAGGETTNIAGPKRWDFPLYIPAGSRLAVQAAGDQTSTAFEVAIFLYGFDGYPPFRVGQRVVTYGMGTVPDGTAITPGASGAEGSWTQITASTSEDHFALVPSFQVQDDGSLNGRQLALDIGIGAATEEEVAQSYWFRTETGDSMGGPLNSMPCFCEVPSGSRLVMRVSNSGANDGGYNGVIHAVS